ncbi:MAG: methyltransferase, partial [Actinomycetota bacterium]
EQYSVEDNWEALDFYQLFPSFCAHLDKLDRQEAVRRFYVWGAATKGCMFAFHLANLGRLREILGFVVDINPAKWSKFVPGTSIPIHSPEYLYKSIEESDAVIVANPNYEIEVRALLANQGLERVAIWSL